MSLPSADYPNKKLLATPTSNVLI